MFEIPMRTILLGVALLATSHGSAMAQSSQVRHEQNRPCKSITAGDAEIVTFESRDIRGETATIEGVFVSDIDDGKRPAVILLHTALGMGPPECYDWMQKQLNSWDYNSLLLDHASAGALGGARGYEHMVFDRFGDLEAAVAFLQQHPAVDPDNIAAIGWSQGALTLLLSFDSNRAFKTLDKPPFKAAIAFYPTCPRRAEHLPVPLLLFHGTADRDAPVESCRAMAAALSPSKTMTFVEYQDAPHLFDHPDKAVYDPDLARDAMDRVRSFLDRYLGENQ